MIATCWQLATAEPARYFLAGFAFALAPVVLRAVITAKRERDR